MHRKYSFILLILLLSSFLALNASAAPPLSGAIFTTDASGDIVNGNTKYEDRCDVFLNGGPGPNAPSVAAGLPDADYYYQVTDPSGKKLLSTDAVQDRCVTVVDGVIDDNCATGTHETNPSNDAGGGVVVQLCPYNLTPNNGGVYKAWMTQVGDFVGDVMSVDNPCTRGCFHGFIPAASKTDNWKIGDKVPTFCLEVYKDIVDDKDEVVPGENWQIVVTDDLGVSNNYFTDMTGSVEVCGLVAGTYGVGEVLQGDSVVLGTTVNGVDVGAKTDVTIMWTKGKSSPQVVEFLNTDCGADGCPK
jgi:hypothetical protein